MNWVRRLNKLVETNFQIAKTYRRMVESVSDTSLKNLLGKLASKRSQFAMELEQEIAAMGSTVSPESKNPQLSGFRTKPLRVFSSNVVLLGNCIKKNKVCLKKYRKTLSKINNGSSREKLLRHISNFENDLKELKRYRATMAEDEKANNSLKRTELQ